MYDHTGDVFGSLTVIRFSHSNSRKSKCWVCKCKCGKLTTVDGCALRSGKTKSCGCERKYHGSLNLKGNKFNNLFVESFSHYENGKSCWNCVCDCGNKVIKKGVYIKNGDTKSCGCLIGGYNIKHGMSNTNIYWIWAEMISRCENKNNHKYKNYGLRGIKVCDHWKSFSNFYDDMGDKPTGMSLDRINNDLNYCKENCRWSNPMEQANNTTRNKLINYKGKILGCKKVFNKNINSNITYKGFLYRLSKGMDVDIALNKKSLSKRFI